MESKQILSSNSKARGATVRGHQCGCAMRSTSSRHSRRRSSALLFGSMPYRQAHGHDCLKFSLETHVVPKDLPRNESRPILMPMPQIPPPQATLSSYIKHCSHQDVLVCNARYLIVIALMLASEGAEDQVIRSKNITALLTLVG